MNKETSNKIGDGNRQNSRGSKHQANSGDNRPTSDDGVHQVSCSGDRQASCDGVRQVSRDDEHQAPRGGVRFALARAVGGATTFMLQKVLGGNGKNMPGKLALYVDPKLIEHLSYKVRRSLVVVGTNGKTTVNNLIADVLEAQGFTTVCNRDGANLDSGISTALLQASYTREKPADWGVFESDELWLIKSLPYLRSDYVLLLNLFRDQLDRCGEIDHIQDVIVQALSASPNTVLVYNGDDPLCALIAKRVNNPSFAFGVSVDMKLPQNSVADAQMCQCCEGIMEYEWRQYGQLGAYRCPECGFARPQIDFAVTNVDLGNNGSSFKFERMQADVEVCENTSNNKNAIWNISSPVSAPYMIYNLAGVASIAQLIGCSESATQKAISAFAPNNGRLQKMTVRGHETLLNLAKNPTGFNQNLKLVTRGARNRGEFDGAPNAVAFFINDKEADGHDVSWLWDIDFEELADAENIAVFAGGTRARDMQVRLKYAGIRSTIIESAGDLFDALDSSNTPDPNSALTSTKVFFIANYTALPQVKADLERMAGECQTQGQEQDGKNRTNVRTNDCGKHSGKVEANSNNRCAHNKVHNDVHGDAHFSDAHFSNSDLRSGATGIINTTLSASVASCASSSIFNSRIISPTPADAPPVVIAHMYPDLLNLYGDAGNVTVLKRRLQWRKIPVEVRVVPFGANVDLNDVDLVFLGGGPDREQRMASAELMKRREELKDYVEEDGVILAICGGYQILGNTWLCDDEEVPGLGILNIRTGRALGGSTNRLIGNIALESDIAKHPIIGFENHAGRTYLGANAQPFGYVKGSAGHGNNDGGGLSFIDDGADHGNNDGDAGCAGDKPADGARAKNSRPADGACANDNARNSHANSRPADGARYKNVIGTYLHGPLLSKNPEVADYLLERACKRCAKRNKTNVRIENGISPAIEHHPHSFANLDDTEELAANRAMAKKLGL